MSFQCEAGHALYKKLHFIGEHFFINYYPVLQVICFGTYGYRTFLINGIGKTILERKVGKHDLSTFMKMGRFLLRDEDPERPIRLYVPALVTRNARALLKLATRINEHQRALPVSKNENFPLDKILNASLPEDEAEEMLQVIVFSVIGRQDRKALDFYKDFTITITKKEILWYPFEDKGNFLVDNFHQYNFPKQSIDITV
ncbi:MAG: hypothetical protein ACMUIU_04055 [bacterium]